MSPLGATRRAEHRGTPGVNRGFINNPELTEFEIDGSPREGGSSMVTKDDEGTPAGVQEAKKAVSGHQRPPKPRPSYFVPRFFA